MKTQKHRKFSFVPLTAEQIREYLSLREAQYAAWETRNKSRASELGLILADLRKSNIAYRYYD